MKKYALIICCMVFVPFIIKSQIPEKKNKRDIYLSSETTINKGTYSLTVRTIYLKDSLASSEPGYVYPIIKQTLIFKHKNTVLKQQVHMVPKTYRILHSGKRVLCLETELTDMGFWVGNKGILYYVEGNACNACPEYYALYSLDGNKLWHMYTLEKTSGQSWLQEKDNYNKIIRQFDIESHDIKVKSILPIGQEIEYSSQVIKPK